MSTCRPPWFNLPPFGSGHVSFPFLKTTSFSTGHISSQNSGNNIDMVFLLIEYEKMGGSNVIYSGAMCVVGWRGSSNDVGTTIYFSRSRVAAGRRDFPIAAALPPGARHLIISSPSLFSPFLNFYLMCFHVCVCGTLNIMEG